MQVNALPHSRANKRPDALEKGARVWDELMINSIPRVQLFLCHPQVRPGSNLATATGQLKRAVKTRRARWMQLDS